jgi:hypothetical protein
MMKMRMDFPFRAWLVVVLSGACCCNQKRMAMGDSGWQM